MSFKVIEAPNKFKADYWNNQSIFLAGGISNCPDWQSEVIQMLNSRPNPVNWNNVPLYDIYKILNPRRANFDVSKEDESVKQIEWEYKALARSSKVVFWFPEETLCPITLLELGKELARRGRFERNSRNLHIGCHPNYKRKLDVKIQTRLAIPSVKVHESLQDVIDSLIKSL